MPDFPIVEARDVPLLSTFGPESFLGDFFASAHQQLASNVWTTANTAIYVPGIVTTPFLAKKIAVIVMTQSGNLDVGIYDEHGKRLVSMGSTAVAVAGLQVLDIADTWLMPGTYFMAMNCDNITAAFFSINIAAAQLPRAKANGVVQQAVGAIALPDPATFAGFSTRSIPGMVVSGVSVI